MSGVELPDRHEVQHRHQGPEPAGEDEGMGQDVRPGRGRRPDKELAEAEEEEVVTESLEVAP
jgi:hypothetical protein